MVEVFNGIFGFDLLEENRTTERVYARYACWLWLREHGHTFAYIGKMFNKTHATVMQGVREIGDKLGINDKMALWAYGKLTYRTQNQQNNHNNMTNYKLVYLSGQITGLHPEEAAKRFAEAEGQYDWEQYTVVNPMRLAPMLERQAGRRLSEAEILIKELEIVAICDEIAMLPGWEKSDGATAEHAVAKKAGVKITYL